MLPRLTVRECLLVGFLAASCDSRRFSSASRAASSLSLAETSARLALTPRPPRRCRCGRLRAARDLRQPIGLRLELASRDSRCSSRAVTVARAFTSSRSRSATPLSRAPTSDSCSRRSASRVASTASRASTRPPLPLLSRRSWRAHVRAHAPSGREPPLAWQAPWRTPSVRDRILELAELGRDLLLELPFVPRRGAARLQVGETLLLRGSRFGARASSCSRSSTEACWAAIFAARLSTSDERSDRLLASRAFLEPRLQVRELVTYFRSREIAVASSARIASSSTSSSRFSSSFRLPTYSSSTRHGLRAAPARRWSQPTASRRQGLVRPGPLPRRDAARAGAEDRSRSPAGLLLCSRARPS